MNSHRPRGSMGARNVSAKRRQGARFTNDHSATGRNNYFSRQFQHLQAAPSDVSEHANMHLPPLTTQPGVEPNANVHSDKQNQQQLRPESVPAHACLVSDGNPSPQLRMEGVFPVSSHLQTDMPFNLMAISPADAGMHASAHKGRIANSKKSRLDQLRNPRPSHKNAEVNSSLPVVISDEAPRYSSVEIPIVRRQENCNNRSPLPSQTKKRPRFSEPVDKSRLSSDLHAKGKRKVIEDALEGRSNEDDFTPSTRIKRHHASSTHSKVFPKSVIDLEDLSQDASVARVSQRCNVTAFQEQHRNVVGEKCELAGESNVGKEHRDYIANSKKRNPLKQSSVNTLQTEQNRENFGVGDENYHQIFDSNHKVGIVSRAEDSDRKGVQEKEENAGGLLARSTPRTCDGSPKVRNGTLSEQVRHVSTLKVPHRTQHLDSNHLSKMPDKGCTRVDRKRGNEFDVMVRKGSIDEYLTEPGESSRIRKPVKQIDKIKKSSSKRVKRAPQKMPTTEGALSDTKSLDPAHCGRTGLTNCPSEKTISDRMAGQKENGSYHKLDEASCTAKRSQGPHDLESSSSKVEIAMGMPIVNGRNEPGEIQSTHLLRVRTEGSIAGCAGREKFANPKNQVSLSKYNRNHQMLIPRQIDCTNMSECRQESDTKVAISNECRAKSETEMVETGSDVEKGGTAPQAFEGPENYVERKRGVKYSQCPVTEFARDSLLFEEDIGELVTEDVLTTAVHRLHGANGVVGEQSYTPGAVNVLSQSTPKVEGSTTSTEEIGGSEAYCVVLSNEHSGEVKAGKVGTMRESRNETGSAPRMTRNCKSDQVQGIRERRRPNLFTKRTSYPNQLFAELAPGNSRGKEQPRKARDLAAVENDSEEGQVILRSNISLNAGRNRTLRRRSAAPVIVVDLTRSSDSDESRRDDVSADDATQKLGDMQLSDNEASIMARQLDPESIGGYLDPLSAAEAKVVDQAFRCKKDTVVVTLKAAGITLHGEDIQKLRGTRWLNDEIINAYVHLINERNILLRADGAAPHTYVFNTFFYTRLTSVAGGYDYAGVRRWTSRAKVDVLRHDLLLVPVNLGNHHWVLSGVDMKNRKIIYLDSMHGRDTANVVTCLQRWIHDEVTDKHGVGVAARFCATSWKSQINYYNLWRTGLLPFPLELETSKAGRVMRMPKQEDGGSCGVFTAKTADCLALGVNVYLRQNDVRLVRERMVLDLLRKSLPR